MRKVVYPSGNLVHYTKDAILENYLFRLLLRTLREDYPWVKNLSVDEKNLNIYKTIFVNIEVDPELMILKEGVEMKPYVMDSFKKGSWSKHSTLRKMVTAKFESSVYDIEIKIWDHIIGLHECPAIPDELKLKNRIFTIGEYYIKGLPEPWS